MPLTYVFKRFVFLTIGLFAVALLSTPECAMAQGATGATYAAGSISNPAAGDTGGVATNSAFGVGAVTTGVDATAIGAASSATAGGIAVGHRATQTGLRAIAIGTDAGSANTPGGIGAQATGQESIALGPDANATAAGAQAYGLNASATGVNSIAMGVGASAGFANSTAIGAGATTSRADQMAFGTASNTYTMAGITSAASTAAQSGPTEFVTTDLNGNLAAVDLGPIFAGVNTRINRAFSRIDNVRNEEQAGIALAIATGNLRYDDRPGKFSVAGGMGGFQHEGGGTLGLGYTAPNQRVRFNVSAGGSTHGDFGGGGGLSFTLN